MDTNQIIIGDKQVMNYVTAILIQLKENQEITIVARGRQIIKAIDAMEIATKQFLTTKTQNTITTNSETLTNNEGQPQTVSSIKILLKKI